MMRPRMWALAGLLAAAVVAGAAAPPTSPRLGRSSDQLDYLFLASDRPVLLREYPPPPVSVQSPF